MKDVVTFLVWRELAHYNFGVMLGLHVAEKKRGWRDKRSIQELIINLPQPTPPLYIKLRVSNANQKLISVGCGAVDIGGTTIESAGCGGLQRKTCDFSSCENNYLKVWCFFLFRKGL